MDELYTRFDGTFFEKTRLSILTIVYRAGRASFNYLKEQLATSDGALYTHVEKLVQGGYVSKRRRIVEGSAQTDYSLTKKGKEVFKDYLTFIEGVLESRSEQGDNT